jgi:tRNA-guanine family transglycosylase
VGRLVNISAGVHIDIADDIPVEALLVNTPDVLKNLNRYRELIQAARPSFKMLDSGGYQIFLKENKAGLQMTFNDDEEFCMTSKKFNIAPRHVVDAAALITPDIVVALDFPIRKLTGDSRQRAEFYMKLPFNRRWALRTSELMTQRGLDTNTLFIPVQCYDIRQFQIFYRCIRGCAFGGFSMPVRNLKLDEILQFLLQMHDWGITRVHLLGTTAAKTVALSAYMARHFFDWVSLDSATYRLAAGYGQYLASEDMRVIKVGHKDPVARTTQITCGCNWCRYYQDFGGIIDLERRHKAGFLYRHNFMAIDDFARNAYANATSAAMLERFVRISFNNEGVANETIQAVREAEQFIGNVSGTTGTGSRCVVQ